MLTPLHDPRRGIMRVVGFMSGSGTNLRRILERERAIAAEEGYSPFEVVGIFSDNADSQAPRIGRDFNVPVLVHDIAAFYAARNAPRSDLFLRQEYDALTVMMCKPFAAKVAAFAGYMSIATTPLIHAFTGVNVHPADLSVENGGRRVYTGDHAVRDAILAGETTLCASTHLIEPEVDQGALLMISETCPVTLPEGARLDDPEHMAIVEEHNQELLKKLGDWIVFPRTLEDMARGRFARDESGALCYDGEPIPKGLRL